jgi:hypothetical protein
LPSYYSSPSFLSPQPGCGLKPEVEAEVEVEVETEVEDKAATALDRLYSPGLRLTVKG